MTISWIDSVNSAIGIAGFTVSMLGLLLSAALRIEDEWTNRFFPLLFSILALYTSADIVTSISTEAGAAGSVAVSQTALFLESLFSSLLMPALTVLILHFAGDDPKHNRIYRAVTVLLIIYLVMLTTTQFTGTFYYFTPDNVYHRGPLYPLLLVPPVLIMAVNLVALVGRRDRLNPNQFNSFLIFIVVTIVCMLIQMVAYGLLMILLGVTVSSLVMFIMLVSSQAEERIRQKEMNAAQQARIAVLQMRPHFIANTLMSIYYLCGRDPEAAQQVILDFSSYLRKNFSAIAGDRTIPFAEELEHTRAYLAVETARFEDMLSVEFDTPHMNFRIPPLTLQPIVENAVQHGLDPDGDPIRIQVRTEATDTESIVTVTDNGPGFEAADDDRPHIALANIQERLEMMCRGRLDIETAPGGGTKVKICLPNVSL